MGGDKEDKSLFEKAIESVKDIASSVTKAVKSAPPSARTETAIPLVEENLDAHPMTAGALQISTGCQQLRGGRVLRQS